MTGFSSQNVKNGPYSALGKIRPPSGSALDLQIHLWLLTLCLLQSALQIRDSVLDLGSGGLDRFQLRVLRLRALLQQIVRGPVQLCELLRGEELGPGDEAGADSEVPLGALKISFVVMAVTTPCRS